MTMTFKDDLRIMPDPTLALDYESLDAEFITRLDRRKEPMLDKRYQAHCRLPRIPEEGSPLGLYYPQTLVTTAEVYAQIANGWVPVMLSELLLVCRQHRHLVRETTLIALGTQYEIHREYPHSPLLWDRNGLFLDSSWHGSGWSRGICFPVIQLA